MGNGQSIASRLFLSERDKLSQQWNIINQMDLKYMHIFTPNGQINYIIFKFKGAFIEIFEWKDMGNVQESL